MKQFWPWVIMLSLLAVSACGGQPAQPVPASAAAPTTAAPQPAAPTTAAPQPAVPTTATVPAANGNGNGQMANPASKNCIDKGGRLDIRNDSSGGQIGVCVFPGGKECEEWALMRGQCSPGGATAGSTAYHNPTYGFGLSIPSTWKIQENSAGDKPSLALTLTNGNNVLRLEVKRGSDPSGLATPTPPAGYASLQRQVTVLGQAIPLQILQQDGKLKSALVNVASSSLLFSFRLDNGVDPEITADALSQAEAIISSLSVAD